MKKISIRKKEARPALIGVTVAEYLRDNNLDPNLQPFICNAVKDILSHRRKVNDFDSDLQKPLTDILNLIIRPNVFGADVFIGAMSKKKLMQELQKIMKEIEFSIDLYGSDQDETANHRLISVFDVFENLIEKEIKK